MAAVTSSGGGGVSSSIVYALLLFCQFRRVGVSVVDYRNLRYF
jgi:hypothetical protein